MATTPDLTAPVPSSDREVGGDRRGWSAPTRWAAGVTAAGAATLAWSLVEAQWFTLRHVHVTGVVRSSLSPVRVLHLSDLHVARPGGRLGHFLASLADEDYDLVVATGDLLGDEGMEDEVAAMLAPLTASSTPGVVVLGSNDVYGPVPRNPLRYLAGPTSDDVPTGARLDTERLVTGLQRQGWTTLRNEATSIPTPRGTVMVSGIDDPHLHATPLPNAEAIATAGHGIVHLGLVHAPYKAALDMLVGVGTDVVLSGHTHGGQVRVPGVGALVTNSDLPPRHARGLSQYRDVPLHVSAGLGTSKYTPIRFMCRPEATLLTLLP
ncbi:MAG TPA: metallophosphoesterase [Nitriliruptoraceae bacterium]|nr:metallophosphoesterase [Nitriliruptoraceae bacterium]